MAQSVDLKTRVIGPDTAVPETGDGVDVFSRCRSNRRSGTKFLRSVGFGGMKSVLLVFDRDTGREVAMAIMPDFRDRPKSDLERFVREARLTAQLEHPNIVPVHDLGIDSSGSPFFTMKYLHGQSLSSVLRKLAKGDARRCTASASSGCCRFSSGSATRSNSRIRRESATSTSSRRM